MSHFTTASRTTEGGAPEDISPDPRPSSFPFPVIKHGAGRRTVPLSFPASLPPSLSVDMGPHLYSLSANIFSTCRPPAGRRRRRRRHRRFAQTIEHCAPYRRRLCWRRRPKNGLFMGHAARRGWCGSHTMAIFSKALPLVLVCCGGSL